MSIATNILHKINEATKSEKYSEIISDLVELEQKQTDIGYHTSLFGLSDTKEIRNKMTKNY